MKKKNNKKLNLIYRVGNKENDIKYFKHLLPLDIDNVIEPFGGSFQVIKNIYFDDKYNKYVNDIDEKLIPIYKDFKKYGEYRIKMNDIGKKYLYDDIHVDIKKIMQDEEYLKLKDSNFYPYFSDTNIVRGNLFKFIKSDIDFTEQYDLFDKINFTFEDYKICIDKHYKNENSFIFLDPPYLFSDNSNYSVQSKKEGKDMTEIIVYILDLFKNKDTKAKFMLIINDLYILRHLFKDYIKSSYKRMYQLSKKEDIHLIICNY